MYRRRVARRIDLPGGDTRGRVIVQAHGTRGGGSGVGDEWEGVLVGSIARDEETIDGGRAVPRT